MKQIQDKFAAHGLCPDCGYAFKGKKSKRCGRVNVNPVQSSIFNQERLGEKK